MIYVSKLSQQNARPTSTYQKKKSGHLIQWVSRGLPLQQKFHLGTQWRRENFQEHKVKARLQQDALLRCRPSRIEICPERGLPLQGNVVHDVALHKGLADWLFPRAYRMRIWRVPTMPSPSFPEPRQAAFGTKSRSESHMYISSDERRELTVSTPLSNRNRTQARSRANHVAKYP